MARTLTTNLKVDINATYQDSLDLSTVKDFLSAVFSDTLASGIGADQADRLWHDQRTLAASASENLDLAGGLTDAFGNTLTFARVKLIYIKAAAANTNNVVVGGHATAAFVNWVADATDKVNIRPGGVFLLFAPDATAYVITAGTGDLLTVANSAGGSSVVYDIVIVGAAA